MLALIRMDSRSLPISEPFSTEPVMAALMAFFLSSTRRCELGPAIR